MTRGVAVMVSCALFTMSSVAYGQTSGWYASADVLRGTAHGDDRHAGDVITSDVTLAGTASDFSSSDLETVRAIAPRLHKTTSAPPLSSSAGLKDCLRSTRRWWNLQTRIVL